jgi:mono/diheme cytochrome c family protein
MRTFIVCLVMLGAATVARADDDPVLKLFKSQCSTCHGKDGKGQTTAGKAAGVKDWTDGKTLKTLTDAQFVEQVRSGKKGDDGKEKMPPFKKLTDEQVKSLIAYVRTNFAK